MQTALTLPEDITAHLNSHDAEKRVLAAASMRDKLKLQHQREETTLATSVLCGLLRDRQVRVRNVARGILADYGIDRDAAYYPRGTLNHDLEEYLYRYYKYWDIQSNEPLYCFICNHGKSFFNSAVVCDFTYLHHFRICDRSFSDEEVKDDWAQYQRLRTEILRVLYSASDIDQDLLNDIHTWNELRTA